MELCPRANFHLSANNFYMALKCLNAIEKGFVEKTTSSTLRKMLEKQIQAIRSHIEKRVSKEFGDWLVAIRIVCRNLDQFAIGQASSARQREEERRIKQRQAEEQSRLSLRDCVYALEEEFVLTLDEDANQLKSAMAEARQLINLLLRSYNMLDYKKIVMVSEKLRDPSDRLFGSFGGRAALKQNSKKKSLDALVKRLKEVS